MTHRIRSLLLLTLLAGCGQRVDPEISPRAKGRPATDTPERFEPSAAYARIEPADTIPGSGCTSPMTDRRTDTKAVMRRAANGVGDYEVPLGMYGVRAGEYLRIECNTGRPLGIVNR